MKRGLVLLLALLSGSTSPARATQFVIAPGGKNLVKFESHAPVETVTGKTQNVQGAVELDPAQLGDSLTVQVRVDLASLDTGNGLRDKHMRENHLETSKYPTVTFTGGRLLQPSASACAAGQKVKCTVAGELDLHGVKRPLAAPIELVFSPQAGELHVTSSFDIKLSDYKINRPQFLVMRLDEVQHITLDIVARSQ